MCGLTGFYAPKTAKSRLEQNVIGKAMSDALSHRGPDSAGLWQDPDVPLLLGHRRLAIIDLTAEGAQPMESASGRYVMAYNGEIYNYLPLQKSLEAAGLKFRGRSDTEVILAAIEHWGLNAALQKLNGMFALALWDRKERALHLIRDRLGKKPLYVGWAGEGKEQALVFASELKALHAHPGFNPVLNRKTLAHYMRLGYVPAPDCIFEHIWSLPAGHRLSLNLEALAPGTKLDAQMQPYWNHLRVLEDSRDRMTNLPDDQILDEFEALLESCVKDRMISDVPLGAFLSGGIDSSAVVALMQKDRAQRVKTYSIGFEEAGFNEAEYAKKIAAHLGTDHHELYVSGQDALDAIPLLPRMYDEPFADISAIPTYLVSKFARQNVTVALSGDGGDEMLGGYTRHVAGPQIWRRIRSIPRPLRSMIGGTISKIPTGFWDKLVPGQPQFGSRIHKAAGILSMNTQEEIYNRLISQWPSPPVLNAGHSESLMEQLAWQPQHNNTALSFSEMMMYKDALSYLPNDILTKVDRASMAVSLEARAPLLDPRIYEHVWRLPERVKIRDGKGKWLLREMLARHVPRDLFERPKQGFTMPVGEWLRGPLSGWAEDLLEEKRLREDGHFDPAPIRAAWEEHKQGIGNHAGPLWTVLMFQAWQDQWL